MSQRLIAGIVTAFEHRIRDYPAVLLLPTLLNAASDAALRYCFCGGRILVDGEGFEPS